MRNERENPHGNLKGFGELLISLWGFAWIQKGTATNSFSPFLMEVKQILENSRENILNIMKIFKNPLDIQ